MNFVIEAIGTSSRLARAAAAIREEVFQDAWQRIRQEPGFEDVGPYLDLVARVESTGEPVGVMAVVETTGDPSLHARFGFPFKPSETSARYTQLAVRKRYRGMDIPLNLILEAKRRFVQPAGIRHTWLLFDAARTTTSCFLCRDLGFRAGGRTWRSEYGRVRILARDEALASTSEADRIAEEYLAASARRRPPNFSPPSAAAWALPSNLEPRLFLGQASHAAVL